MKPPTPPAHNISLRTTRMLMRVFSLENDQSQRQHNGQTHPQLGSVPGKCGCVCTVCSAPSGARNVQGQQKGQWTGECCPGWHLPQLLKLLPESFLWFNQCHSKWLSSMLPSLTCRSSHTAVFVTEIARSRGWEGGQHTHTSDTFSVSYSPLQLLPIAAGAHSPPSHTPSVSFFPAFSSCPTAASGKSQPLSGETAAGENWSLSSITGAASRAGSLPILALLWLLYCSCTDNRQTSCILPTKPGSVWVFSQASEMINSYIHRDTDSTGRWSKSQISGQAVSKRDVKQEFVNAPRQRRELQLWSGAVKKG